MKYKSKKTLRTITIVLLVIIAIVPSCSYFYVPSRKLLNEAMNEKFDIVVVPGVPFENGKWSTVMKQRVYWSKYLFDKGIARNVMYSGDAVYTPYIEAEIMAMYASAIGIPDSNIYTETKASHSTENIYYSYKLASKLGFTKIALASDALQTKMLSAFVRKKVSEKIYLLPLVADTIKAMESFMKDPEIDYSKAFVTDFIPITESTGWFKHFKGTLGFDIDTSFYN
jgi:hypothetical protein